MLGMNYEFAYDGMGMILACEMNEWFGTKGNTLLIWDEALDSWSGDDPRYGFEIWYVWGINLKGCYRNVNMI